MALDWIALAGLLLQGASTASAMSRKTPEAQMGTVPAAGGEQGQAASSPLQNMPTTQPATPQPIDTGPMTEVAAQLSQYGPPPSSGAPTTPMPTTAGEKKDPYAEGPPKPSEDPLAAQQGDDIGRLLASLPEAIALAAPLLGLGQQPQQRPGQILPPTGGPQGQMAMAGPQRQSIGQVLANLPRLR